MGPKPVPVQDLVNSKCNEGRVALGVMEEQLRDFKNTIIMIDRNEDPLLFDRNEVLAQLTIALRAVEDARMRLGKVIQYANGGVSSYDQKTT